MAGNVLTAKIKVETQGVKQAFDNTASSAKKASDQLKNVGFDDFTQKTKAAVTGINAANLATQNFGRVLQDLPFGFIGIANNLNPLLESFQRLKAETGSVGGAFKALGSSLLGAGGLGLALSAVTAAASFASIGMTFWGDKLFGASAAEKEAADKAKELKDAIDGAFESTAREATRVDALVAILKNETETRVRRNAAIKELKDLQPEIFAGLKQEGDAVIGLDTAYKAYLANLKTVLAAKIIQAELEQKITELLKLQGVAQTKAFNNAVAQLKKLGDATKKTFEPGPTGSGKTPGEVLLEKQTEKTKLLESEIEGLAEKLVEFSKGISVNIEKGKVVKAFEFIRSGIVDGLNDVQKLLDLNPNKLALPFQVVLDENKLTLQFSAVKQQLNDKLHQFDLKPIIIPVGVRAQIQEDADKQKFLTEFTKKEFAEARSALFGLSGLDLSRAFNLESVSDSIAALTKQLFGMTGELKKIKETNAFVELSGQIQKAAELTTSVLSPAFGKFFDGLVQGQIKIKNFLSGMLDVIKQLIAKLLTAAAISAVIAGISGGSFSSIFSSLIGFREKGGPVGKGKRYVVNEKGPELFQPNAGRPMLIAGGRQLFSPPVSGKIIPHWQTERILKNQRLHAAAFSNPFGKISGYRSGGGSVVAGNNYIVNEAGREIFIPNTGQAINVRQPSGNVRSGSISVTVGGQIDISGNKLVAVLANTQRSQGRTT